MSRRERIAMWLVWGVLAVPALAQLYLLAVAIVHRFAYPYDLEWMEGGLLVHAERISERDGIYVEPSIEFIPYLYTPLYPALLALLRPMVGLSYQVGRAVSVASLAGVLVLIAVAIVKDSDREHRAAGWVGAALAAGAFAAAYPFVDGWYDIVRADTLFLLLIMGGLVGIRRWARAGHGAGGQLRIAAVAAILALSFFCKQTGVLYVVAGGGLLLVLNWRRLAIYIGVSAAIGLGGTALLNAASSGWFWTYAYEVHQVHDFSRDRFVDSFGNMLWQFPGVTAVIAVGLLAVTAATIKRRALPPSAGGLLTWTYIYAVSCVVGALGWGTQWAHFNAYVPALLTGAIAAGATVPALIGAAGALGLTDRRARSAFGVCAAAALGAQLIFAWWDPSRFIPRDADRAAGDRLIVELARIDGDVYVPFHPWYARLAGKQPHTHRMGVMDVSYKQGWPVRDLRESIASHRFAAIVWDNKPVLHWFPGLEAHYRLYDSLPNEARPQTYTGARTSPKWIWVPAVPTNPPEGATALWSFERGGFDGWRIGGTAWGKRPVAKHLPKQGTVRRFGGRYFATSFHGGDRATGELVSPEFTITGERITLLIGGSKDATHARAELIIDGVVVATATGAASNRMEDREWLVGAHRGKRARIRLVDDATGSWGHLNVDEIWMWKR